MVEASPPSALVPAMIYNALTDRVYRLHRTDPTHHAFVPNTHRHNIIPGQRPVVTPMKRRIRIREIAPGRDAGVESDQLAYKAAADHGNNRLIKRQGHRRGHDLCRQPRMPPRGRKHAMPFGRIHRHTCFAHNVLPGFQRRDGQRLMHIRPSSDADRIDAVVVQNFLPIRADFLDPKLAGDLASRSNAAVRHCRQLYACLRLCRVCDVSAYCRQRR